MDRRRFLVTSVAGGLVGALADEIAGRAPRSRKRGARGDVGDRGYLLSLACSCGVTFLRWVTPEEAIQDLVGRHCGLRSA